ncbi:hypothetical protein KH5H1_58430 [Corallococcus caeni]|nr:hypothetical protein KH5H1_58430 [Corallococcus sp. KH5-1]
MHREQQQVFGRRDGEQHGAQQGPLLQVERRAGLLVQPAPGLLGVSYRHDGKGHVQFGRDALPRPAVLLHEGGAQHRVAAHHFVQAARQ